jgi:hypothetical protein
MSDQNHLIFVNYRGTDEIWATEFVYARMTEAFGAETVFKAGNALRPGDSFAQILLEKAASCPVMLACVGPAWLAAQSADGRRLDSPDDWVRREIETSLRAGNRVIPLLLGDQGTVAMPKPADLPPEVGALFGRQAARLTPGGGLDLTVPRLNEKLIEHVPELGARRIATRSGATGAKPAATTGSGHFAGANFGNVGMIVAGDQTIHGPLTVRLDGLAEENR